ncbi:hypothetical protein [Cytophaga aurantiaca]|uniref:hypothetical protein n=1 Tax=Cytophaga aurantiaca TaxID=29530 RepID=UPI0003688675|nr:hypothetical protein [Cytophaga aurantiaca]
MKITRIDLRFVVLFLLCSFVPDSSFGQSSELIEKVCANLNLKIEDCYLELASEKRLPTDSSKSIVVIPKIVEHYEDYFSFDSYILVVETSSGKIISMYFESASTNNWISDANKLRSITIDTAPYMLNTSTRAFGIRVRYEGSSRANPYYEEVISLFIQQGEKIIQVLNKYTLLLENGEMDGICASSFWTHKKVLIISKDKTKSFANIVVKDKITNSVAVPQNNDCIQKETHSSETEILKYDGVKYKGTL